MPIPLSSIITSSFDNAVTTSNASSNVCTTTYIFTLPDMLAKIITSHKSITDSLCKPNRKRKREHSGSSFSVSRDEMWVAFQQFMAPRLAAGYFLALSHPQSRSLADRSGPSSSSSSLACQRSFRRDWHASLAHFGHPTSQIQLAYPVSPACLAWPSSSDRPSWPTSPAHPAWPASSACPARLAHLPSQTGQLHLLIQASPILIGCPSLLIGSTQHS